MDMATYAALKKKKRLTIDARILALNPLGYWKLQDGSGGTAIDSSGNNLNGSISGASWGVQVGVDGTPALYFDGINDVVTVAETAILQPVSVTVFFLARATAGTGCALSMDDGSWSYAYGLFGFPSFQIQNGGSVSTGGTFTADTWQSWAWTYSAATGVLNAYRNGTLLLTASGSAANILYNPGLQLRIGQRIGHSFYSGALQHVAIFGSALSNVQIEGIYAP